MGRAGTSSSVSRTRSSSRGRSNSQSLGGLNNSQSSSLNLSGGLSDANIRSVASAFGTSDRADGAIRSVSSRNSSRINSASLSNATPIQLPTQNQGENQMATLMGNNQGLADPSMGLITNATGGLEYTQPTETAPKDSFQNLFEQYLGQTAEVQKKAPNFEKSYRDLEKQSGVRGFAQEEQNLISQLNTITSKAQAQSLSLEDQGRGQTGSFIGGEQARVSREAAIQALPIQALLANAQGNKALAQTHLDTMFKLKMQDAQSVYEFETKKLSAVYDYLTQSEKRKADEMIREEDRAFTIKRDEISFENQKYMSQMGFNQQIELKQMGINADNARFAAENPPLSPLTLANKESSINQLSTLAKPSAGMSSAVGTSYLTRSTGFWGSVGKVFTGLLGGAGAGAVAGSVVPVAGTLVGAVAGGVIGAGVSAITLAKQSYSKLSGSEQDFIAGVTQITSELTKDKLAQAKGAGVTFGALNEGERLLVAGAASTIASYEIREGGKLDGKVIGYNASEKSMRDELNKINNFKRLDYVLQGGSPEAVGVQVVGDEYQFRNPDGTISILYRQ